MKDKTIEMMQQHLTDEFYRWVRERNREWILRISAEQDQKPMKTTKASKSVKKPPK